MPDPRHEAHHELPDDWTRRAGEALADGSALDAIREHLAEGGNECLEWCPICRGADLLRANTSPELREQWDSVQREALRTVRALIDHYLERLESDRPDPESRVRDIPID